MSAEQASTGPARVARPRPAKCSRMKPALKESLMRPLPSHAGIADRQLENGPGATC
jgi:hypothetical protein